jgi:hypothetical protein
MFTTVEQMFMGQAAFGPPVKRGRGFRGATANRIDSHARADRPGSRSACCSRTRSLTIDTRPRARRFC